MCVGHIYDKCILHLGFMSSPARRDWILEITKFISFKKKLKEQWRVLWWNRIDDRVRAEGIASQSYPDLFVERGTVIVATRDYKPPSFHEILEMHLSSTVAETIDSPPSQGGVGKFIREVIRRQSAGTRKRPAPPPKSKSGKKRQLKKGGRGWLHFKRG